MFINNNNIKDDADDRPRSILRAMRTDALRNHGTFCFFILRFRLVVAAKPCEKWQSALALKENLHYLTFTFPELLANLYTKTHNTGVWCKLLCSPFSDFLNCVALSCYIWAEHLCTFNSWKNIKRRC